MSARDDEKDAGDRTTLPPVVRFLEQRFWDQPLAGQLMADELMGRGRGERIGPCFRRRGTRPLAGVNRLFLLTMRAVGWSSGRLCGREADSWWL